MNQPCDHRELGLVRGLLLSVEACAWFVGMGIGWDVFTDKRCQVLAAWALGGCKGKPPKVETALEERADGSYSIGEWLRVDLSDNPDANGQPYEFTPEWGFNDVRRYTRELAGRWLPQYLRRQADFIAQHGDTTALDALVMGGTHHRKVLDFIAGDAA